MNRMLVVVFESEASAALGVQALHALHAEGSLTLYALGVIAMDSADKVTVKQLTDTPALGTGVGFGVGSLIGLLGGPAGLAVGAIAGSLLGALRDYWVAGVGVDFVEEARGYLRPGRYALIAEVEEEWVMPVDSRMKAAGGVVFRRARVDMAHAQYDRDIVAFKGELASLGSEAKHASDATKAALEAKLTQTRALLERVEQGAKRHGEELTHELEGKVQSLEQQLGKTSGDAKKQLQHRVEQVRASYNERSKKLGKAWRLAMDALGS